LFGEPEVVDGLAGCDPSSGLASADAPESGDAGAVEVALALRAVGRVVLAGVDSCMSSFPMPSLASLPANRPFFNS